MIKIFQQNPLLLFLYPFSISNLKKISENIISYPTENQIYQMSKKYFMENGFLQFQFSHTILSKFRKGHFEKNITDRETFDLCKSLTILTIQCTADCLHTVTEPGSGLLFPRQIFVERMQWIDFQFLTTFFSSLFKI